MVQSDQINTTGNVMGMQKEVMPTHIVKITKSRKDTYWYRHKIGQTFMCADYPDDNGKFIVIKKTIKTGRYVPDFGIIRKDSCRVVLEINSATE